ncbi:butyrophilin subfamily 1 member A1-like [Polypterus senegalus]|uniref:butyrophilin subfamily 1 member A1-like n=1 Tax=Polypterus senegalus TaxID=55291 RepID=UPI001962E603|nr:butyrophilin subfamily 1 member A1-like [Polypterus senegalus]
MKTSMNFAVINGYLIFMALLQFCKSQQGTFTVETLSPTVAGHLNGDVILPCALSPKSSAVGLEIRWVRKGLPEPVHLYINGNDNFQLQNKDYQGRTQLYSEELKNGNVSLLLKNIRLSDAANYTCSVLRTKWFGESSIELKVLATGRTPRITFDGRQGNGIGLSCMSSGWHPKPQVLWLSNVGTDLTSRSETKFEKDKDRLYSVRSNFKIEANDHDGVTCRIRGLQDTELTEARVQINADLFQTSSPWKAGFAVTFLFLLLALGLLGAAFLYWMKNRVFIAIQESEKKDEESCQETTAKLAESEKPLLEEKDMHIKHLESEITRIKKDKENLTKHRDSDIQQIKDEKDNHIRHLETEIEKSRKEEKNLKEQLGTAKSESEKLKQDCSDLHNEIKNRGYVSNQELEEMRSVRANITISQDKSSKNVKVSEEGKKVRAKTTIKLTGWDCAIANESFSAGRHYWEVNMGDIPEWRLGVTSNSDFTEEKNKTKARQYYLALKWKDKKFTAVNGEQKTELTSKQKARVIGVFLDYDKGRLSFYNLDDTSHIHTLIFTTKLPLYPLFNCVSSDKDLVILS